MTHQPRLSVVIGVHNAETVIAECLAALERQDGRAHAEIIVADSSTDGTPEIVRRQFPDVRLLHSDAPLALPQLRGRGIAVLQGELSRSSTRTRSSTRAGCWRR